jgi:phenylalanine-4-hydroxylase
MLSVNNRKLDGHGIRYHKDGFGSPVGKLEGISGNIETMSDGELGSNGIIAGKDLNLEFESGVLVNGHLEKISRKQGCNLIFSFRNCLVTYKDSILFKPEWGIYDMAVGEKITSVYAGPADPDAFELKYPAPEEKTHHIQYTDSVVKLHELYEKVRSVSENRENMENLASVWQALQTNYPDEWLLPLEIAELLLKDSKYAYLAEEIIQFLNTRSKEDEEIEKLVSDGLLLITNQ